MPRGEDVFSKIEPSFGLGLTEAGRRFRSLSKINRLAYYDLWMAAVELRQDTFELDKATEKLLLNFCDFSKKDKLFFFLLAAKDLNLIRVLAEKDRKIFRFQILHVRQKHSGYKFKASPNGERTPPDQSPECPRGESKELRTSSVGSPHPEGWTEEEEISSPEKTAEASPAVRMLEKFREQWDAIRSAFRSPLDRGGIETPEQLAKVALQLEAQSPERDLKAALMATSHHLEALADPAVTNPFGAAMHRAGNHQQLRNGTFGKLQAALDGATPAKPGGQISAAEIVCSLCGKKRIVSRRGDEPVPEICPACELQKAKAQLASEGVTLS